MRPPTNTGSLRQLCSGLSGGEWWPVTSRLWSAKEKLREDDLRLDGWAFARIQPDEVRQLAVVHQKVEKARALARQLQATQRAAYGDPATQLSRP